MYHICFSVRELREGEDRTFLFNYEVMSHGVRVAKGSVDVVLLDGYLPPTRGVTRMCVTASKFFVALMDGEELRFWVASPRNLEKVTPSMEGRYIVLYIWEPELACYCGEV